MHVNRRDLIKTAGAMAAALPLAELPIGGAGKGAPAAPTMGWMLPSRRPTA